MGVHTGDSVTVAPQMTLSDEAYQELRDAAIAVIRAVGVESGGSNIQFARERETGELRVIEMNPRVSRSSALASKATGYPIAKVAAKLAVGYTLDEIPNDLTGTTPASFEPTLDYVVVKFPRFAFEKFPGADTTLGTQMKSVGEAMGIGRTFGEAFLKARRSRELDGADAWELPEGAHPWFRAELERLEAPVGHLDDLVADDWVRLKRLGLSDAAIAARWDDRGARTREAPRLGRPPAYRRVDSCAAEVEARSNYFYSTWGEADEARPDGAKPRVVILGSGPNRIGQGIEFDYCCVHAAQAFRALGYEAVMVNCNPETVSTDYDTSDRLYFEPLGAEEVLEICARELPDGVVIQFGGQTPLKLAREIEARRLADPRDAVRGGRPRRGSRAVRRRSATSSTSTCPRGRWPRAPERGRVRGRGDRVPGARPALVRPRRAEHAGLLRRRVGRRGGADRWPRADRQLPRGRDRDRRRRALRRPGDARRRGDGARRRGGSPLRRLLVRAARALAGQWRCSLESRESSSDWRRRSESSASSTSSWRCRRARFSCSRRTRALRAPSRSRARRSGSTSSRPPAASPREPAWPT